MKYNPKSLLKLAALGLSILVCVIGFAGCWSSTTSPPVKPIEMQWFPETIGNFHRTSEPVSTLDDVEAEYKNDVGKTLRYSFYNNRNMVRGASDKDGETLFESAGISLRFMPTDELEFAAGDGGKSVLVKTKDIGVMNEWANTFPYEKFGFKPSKMPLKIELPPADFVKKRGKVDPELDSKFKATAVILLNTLMKTFKTNLSVGISTIDPSTLITDSSSGSVLSQDQIKEVVETDVGYAGFRQIFIHGTAYPFSTEKNKTIAPSTNANKRDAKLPQESPKE
jgi:hypothetical protein